MMEEFETTAVVPLATALLFGTIQVCTVALAVRIAFHRSPTRSMCDATEIDRTKNSVSASFAAFDLNNSPIGTTFTVLYYFSILGTLLGYAYLCEFHPPFAHAEKTTFDCDEFWSILAFLALVLVVGINARISHGNTDSSNLITTTSSAAIASDKECERPCSLMATPKPVEGSIANDDGILNRQQTQEWKGWMQIVILLVQYYDVEVDNSTRAKESNNIYLNAVRVLISCYAWLTGFGHVSFFNSHRDFSLVRVLRILWRLNFLAVCLCLSQGKPYQLYGSVCFSQTYWFLVVYTTMKIAQHYQHSQFFCMSSGWGGRLQVAILACVLFLVWDTDTGIFYMFHRPFLKNTPSLGAPLGALSEWYLSSSVDHWLVLWGMIFALNLPAVKSLVRKLETLPRRSGMAMKATMGAILLAATLAWTIGPITWSQIVFAKSHSYFGIIPILAYVFFRNIAPWMRMHNLEMFHSIGKTTLEVYLLHHHIWLTSNADTILTLFPGWPKMNALVVTIVFVFVSRQTHHVTCKLREFLLPDSGRACVRNLCGLALIWSFFLVIALFLHRIHLLNLFTIGACSTVLGLLMYQGMLLGSKWSVVEATDKTQVDKSKKEWMYDVISPFMFVIALAIVTTGLLSLYMARSTSGPIRLLHSSCKDLVHQGNWIPIENCNEYSRGVSYREYGVGSLGTCMAAYAWGWVASLSSPSSSCRFGRRDPKNLQHALYSRNVTFVGDSIVRHLYHATCRQLGDTHAGSFNTSLEKWSDISRKYGTTTLEFRWAPFIKNLTRISDQLLVQLESRPDLVVLGGGAWDRLHTYHTVAEQESLGESINLLSNKLRSLRTSTSIPVVWVVPTTINSWALTSDQKRENIREEQMEALRTLYRSGGINDDTVSFVLSGPAFTVDRVEESYDGVHYPLSVYDGGAQILANALDWLLLKSHNNVNESTSLESELPTGINNPYGGLVMLALCGIGLLCLDSFLGISYCSAVLLSVVLIVPFNAAQNLYREAWASLRLHDKQTRLYVTASATDREAKSNFCYDFEKQRDSDDEELDRLTNASKL